MLEKMFDVSIPWGYHTMVKKLEFCDKAFFIGKFVRNSDGLVSWHMHDADTGVSIGTWCYVYSKEDDTPENAKKALDYIVKEFEKHIGFEISKLL